MLGYLLRAKHARKDEITQPHCEGGERTGYPCFDALVHPTSRLPEDLPARTKASSTPSSYLTSSSACFSAILLFPATSSFSKILASLVPRSTHLYLRILAPRLRILGFARPRRRPWTRWSSTRAPNCSRPASRRPTRRPRW
jgi:hypothetical protein